MWLQSCTQLWNPHEYEHTGQISCRNRLVLHEQSLGIWTTFSHDTCQLLIEHELPNSNNVLHRDRFGCKRMIDVFGTCFGVRGYELTKSKSSLRSILRELETLLLGIRFDLVIVRIAYFVQIETWKIWKRYHFSTATDEGSMLVVFDEVKLQLISAPSWSSQYDGCENCFFGAQSETKTAQKIPCIWTARHHREQVFLSWSKKWDLTHWLSLDNSALVKVFVESEWERRRVTKK